jgi:hypothetical protein
MSGRSKGKATAGALSGFCRVNKIDWRKFKAMVGRHGKLKGTFSAWTSGVDQNTWYDVKFLSFSEDHNFGQRLGGKKIALEVLDLIDDDGCKYWIDLEEFTEHYLLRRRTDKDFDQEEAKWEAEREATEKQQQGDSQLEVVQKMERALPVDKPAKDNDNSKVRMCYTLLEESGEETGVCVTNNRKEQQKGSKRVWKSFVFVCICDVILRASKVESVKRRKCGVKRKQVCWQNFETGEVGGPTGACHTTYTRPHSLTTHCMPHAAAAAAVP